MKKLLFVLLCFSSTALFAGNPFVMGAGTHRDTFQSSDTTSRTTACTRAKGQAEEWLTRNQSFAYNTTHTSMSECQCDQPSPRRTGRKVCPSTGFAVDICDASRLIDEVIEFPWNCAVDATITRTDK